MLNADEIKLVNTGFGHMVDKGYGKLESAADVLKVIEVDALRFHREIAISKRDRLNTEQQEAIVQHLDLLVKALRMRVGA